ncbi:MAG: TlpA family protein disulfide reductase [Bradymonadaceae bacterium]
MHTDVADGSEGVDRRTIVNVVVGGILLGLLLVNVVRWVSSPANADLVGKPAPSFELPAVRKEEPVALSDYRGRVVLLDFWATWCRPCRRQASNLEELTEGDELDTPVKVLAVNTDEPSPGRRKKVENYVEHYGVEATTLLDNGRISNKYQVRTIPSIVVVGPEGRVQYADVGVHPTSKLRKVVRRAAEGKGT